MKKSDLNQGAICKISNGSIYILVGDGLINLNNGGFISLSNYKENLECKDCYSGLELDIEKVYNPSFINSGYEAYISGEGLPWSWVRATPKEMTIKEISDALGYNVRVIDRN